MTPRIITSGNDASYRVTPSLSLCGADALRIYGPVQPMVEPRRGLLAHIFKGFAR